MNLQGANVSKIIIVNYRRLKKKHEGAKGDDILSQVWMTHDLDPETQIQLQKCRLAAPGLLRFLQGHLVLHVSFPHIRLMNCRFVANKSLRTCFLRVGDHRHAGHSRIT